MLRVLNIRLDGSADIVKLQGPSIENMSTTANCWTSLNNIKKHFNWQIILQVLHYIDGKQQT